MVVVMLPVRFECFTRQMLALHKMPSRPTLAGGPRACRLSSIIDYLWSKHGASIRLLPNTNGSVAGLKSDHDRGHPVIVHDYFTRSGHVVVVLGYDEEGYYVHDPAGAWSQVFKGCYSSGGSGRATFYRRSAFEAAIATSDGYNRLPLWYHSLR